MYLSYMVKVTVTFLAAIIGVSSSSEDFLVLHHRGQNSWERYGAPVLLVLRGAVEHYMQIDYLLGATDEDLMGYKKAYLLECNMIAVAAAIISQVALTALQFQAIYEITWTARGAFVFSLVSGCFSVYAACTQQRLMTNLTRPDQLRAWLTADPQAQHSEIRVDRQNSGITKIFSDGSAARPSLPTVLTLTAPRTLLDCSTRCFLIGLGIYLVSIWAVHSTASGSTTSNLWTMNTYYISVAVGLSLFISPSSYKNFSLARDRETQLQRREVSGGNEKELEPWGPNGAMTSGFRATSVKFKSGKENMAGDRSSSPAQLSEHKEALRGMEKALRASAVAHEQSAREMLAAAELCNRLFAEK